MYNVWLNLGKEGEIACDVWDVVDEKRSSVSQSLIVEGGSDRGGWEIILTGRLGFEVRCCWMGM